MGLGRKRKRAQTAEAVPEDPATTGGSPSGETVWFWEHYGEAADTVIGFLKDAGVSLESKRIADVGCGDGIIDLGVAQKAAPALLTGFDVNRTDATYLGRRAQEEGLGGDLPANLEFLGSQPTAIPAESGSYDVAVTWSAFEHVSDPVPVLREIRRILRPEGVLFVQLWPFYYSERGSHLWDWFPEGFPNLLHSEDHIASYMRANPFRSAEWTEYMLDEYRHLNRITVDELQNALLAAGFGVRKFELMTHPVHIGPSLLRYPLSQLGISGVKLLATPLP